MVDNAACGKPGVRVGGAPGCIRVCDVVAAVFA